MRNLVQNSSFKMHRQRRIAAAIAAVGLLAFVVGSAAPANAATTASAESTVTTVVQMISGGFRADVAEANGYQILTAPDGTQSSVPITEEAIAQRAAADAAKVSAQSEAPAGLPTPNGTVDGDCGSSWINAVKQANNTVAYSTGYIVFGAVVSSQWQVVASGFVSGNSVLLNPGPNSGTWETEGALYNVVGPGLAYVTVATSFAVLASGQVCYSGGPSASFG